MRIAGFCLIALLAFVAIAAPAFAEKRVALIIGNGAYQSVAALPNPARDAEAMAGMFRAAGFDDVKVETNVGVAAMRRALRAFADKAADADTAVVFFAGHGVEIGGRNYLVPVDAALKTDLDVKDEAVDLDRVLELLDTVKGLKLVILDACRENPFASRMKLTTSSRSVGRGLAPPEPQTSNTLVAYAARAGAVAADGDGRNSPFTAALVNNLTKPGLDVRIALGLVHDEVLQATGRKQEPFFYGALGGGTLALGPPVPTPQPSHQEVAAVTPVAPAVWRHPPVLSAADQSLVDKAISSLANSPATKHIEVLFEHGIYDTNIRAFTFSIEVTNRITERTRAGELYINTIRFLDDNVFTQKIIDYPDQLLDRGGLRIPLETIVAPGEKKNITLIVNNFDRVFQPNNWLLQPFGNEEKFEGWTLCFYTESGMRYCAALHGKLEVKH